jgi:hypothetical protein
VVLRLGGMAAAASFDCGGVLGGWDDLLRRLCWSFHAGLHLCQWIDVRPAHLNRLV